MADRYNAMSSEQRLSVIESLGSILGQMMRLQFDHYGSLTSQSGIIVGPLVDPLRSLHRDCNLADAGPWSLEGSCNLIGALAARELQWLTSPPGLKLFHEWRGEMYSKEDSTKMYPIFVGLCQALLEVIPHMYSLFPVPSQAFRPALGHPDYHFSNIIVSHKDPTLVTGVIDWECAAVLPLWDAYSVPWMIVDNGDEHERSLSLREEKRRLRETYGQAVIAACPDTACVVDAMNARSNSVRIQDSVRGLRALRDIATTGVALYKSRDAVEGQLQTLRQLCVPDAPLNVVQILDQLIDAFSRSL